MTQVRRIATSRDDLIIEDRRKASGASAAGADRMLTSLTDAAE